MKTGLNAKPKVAEQKPRGQTMFRTVLLILLLVMTVSCGRQVVVEHVPPPPMKMGQPQRVVILPFDDYALLDEEGKKPLRAWYRENTLVHGFLAERWAQMGYFAVPFEEMFFAFKRNGWLEIEYPKKENKPKRESDIWDFFRAQMDIGEDKHGPTNEKKTVMVKPWFDLNESDVYRLGRMYGAKYVVRGRIASVSYMQEHSANPLKGGLFAGTLNFVTRGLFGNPSGERFGQLQRATVAGLIGGVIGSNAKDPFEPPHEVVEEEGHPLLPLEVVKETGGNEDYEIWNSLIYGTAGATLGVLAGEGGIVDRVKVEMSIYVYDVENERLVWYDNVRVDASPQSFLSNQDDDSLLYEAVLGASQTLMSRLQRYFFGFPAMTDLAVVETVDTAETNGEVSGSDGENYYEN